MGRNKKLWGVKAVHRHFPQLKSANKTYVFDSRDEGNRFFATFPGTLYRPVWRGWIVDLGKLADLDF